MRLNKFHVLFVVHDKSIQLSSNHNSSTIHTAVVTIIYISRNQNNSKNDKAKVNHNVIDQGQMVIDNELKVHLMSELK